MRIIQVINDADKKYIARNILEALPEWFGIPESREEYIRDSVGKGNRSINPRYRKVVVPGIHTAENHDFISSDQGSRSSISKSLLCSARSGNMLSR